MHRQIIPTPVREILLIDGSRRSAELIRGQFRFSTAQVILHSVLDGEEAVSFLTQKGEHSWAPRPLIILMGLALVEAGGLEMIVLVKGDAHFARIPLIVLSSPREADSDIEKAYEFGANCCVEAPESPSELVIFTNFIKRFWLEVISLPVN